LLQTHTFITGCGHSGTSLLANMFAAHPLVFIPHDETNCFLNATNYPQRWERLSQKSQASGKPHFVEKTPRHVNFIDRIRNHVTGCRFILMARDGRDVAASFVKRNDSALIGAERWIRENLKVIEALEQPDAMLLRYEDLVSEPESSLSKVCAFAGIPYSEAMLSYHEEKRLWFKQKELRKGSGVEGDEHRALRNWQINQPIFDGRQAWKTILTESDLSGLPWEQMRPIMQRFGYSMD